MESFFTSKKRAEIRRRSFAIDDEVICAGYQGAILRVGKVTPRVNSGPSAIEHFGNPVYDFDIFVSTAYHNGSLTKEWWLGSGTSKKRGRKKKRQIEE